MTLNVDVVPKYPLTGTQNQLNNVTTKHIVDTVTYLAYFWETTHPTLARTILADYKKLTRPMMVKGLNDWKVILTSCNMDPWMCPTALWTDLVLANIFKAQLSAATVTKQNESKLKISFYQIFEDMAIVVGNHENTISTRVVERLRYKAFPLGSPRSYETIAKRC